MDARWGRLAAALVVVASIGPAAFAVTAQAATVTSAPPLYAKPGDGPFTWSFAPSVAGAPVAWKLTSETAWHRCVTDSSATFATLPEGRYGIAVADDADGCSPSDTTPPAGLLRTPRESLVVDGTPPVAPVPLVVPLGPQFFSQQSFSLDASASTDALSGIASYTWLPYDGAAPVGGARASRITHSYAPGVWTGAVAVTDRAGNVATRGFTVTTSAPVMPPDVMPPAVRELHVAPGVLAGRALPIAMTLSERAAATITARVRAAGRTYRLPAVRRALLGNRLVTVHLLVKAPVRRAIARALRRHHAVRASARVVVVDQAGNRGSAAGVANITG